MPSNRVTYIKNILLPCLCLSTVAGICTGALIFLFKLTASFVIEKSEAIYAYVRWHPETIPMFLIGITLIGLVSAVLLRFVPDARGGGIPTAIAILRGLISFQWLKTIIGVFVSSMCTYFAGVPLGNEGPSVQMGTAVGRGTTRLFAGKNKACDRYIMTGGACAGFAAATGSPITGIVFAIEEAHRRMSPMIFMAAAATTIAGTATAQWLSELVGVSFQMFHFTVDMVLPMAEMGSALAIGLIAGFTAAGFTKAYNISRNFIKIALKKVPFVLKITLIFLLSACAGIISASCIGSGHHLIETLMEGHGVAWSLIWILLVRVILLMAANNADVTGGLFVPQLAFGAVIGALCGKIFIAWNLMSAQYYPVMVVMGIAAYLSASSRTPLIALAFSMEALDGLTNILPITIAVTVAFLVIEVLGMTAFTDTVLESKVEAYRHGRQLCVVETDLVVAPDTFVCGKEARDLLLPPTCVILSIHKNEAFHVPSAAITEGDILHVHFQSWHPTETMRQLEDMVGKQSREMQPQILFGNENEQMPEL